MFVIRKGRARSFGSELKALRAGPAFDKTIDIDGLSGYLRYLYVPAPRTIYRYAIKIPPGTYSHDYGSRLSRFPIR